MALSGPNSGRSGSDQDAPRHHHDFAQPLLYSSWRRHQALASAADTYLCYKAKLTNGPFPKGIQTTLTDMFETNRLYDVKKPRRVCLPVDTGDRVTTFLPHLVCYQVKIAKGEPKHPKVVGLIHAMNEFGSERLDTLKQDELCVPGATVAVSVACERAMAG